MGAMKMETNEAYICKACGTKEKLPTNRAKCSYCGRDIKQEVKPKNQILRPGTIVVNYNITGKIKP